VYVCFIDEKLAGFLSVLHFPHPKVKNMKKVHRLVILPDYQGAGFGIKFLNEIGKKYKDEGFRYTIVTSSPSLVHALKERKEWACVNHGRKQDNNNITSGSQNRITTSWELK
jgi:GNAT superfamily N-acetyltransferase